MDPKDKAKELVDKMLNCYQGHIDEYTAKQCALIAVIEILESNPRYPNNVDWDDAGGTHRYYYESQMAEAEKYWYEVKQEIEKI
jgi:hypothetical protein